MAFTCSRVVLRSMPLIGRAGLAALGLYSVSGLLGCQTQKPHVVPQGASSGSSQIIGKTWDLCTWLGPSTKRPGIFGSDLGIAVPLPNTAGTPAQLGLVFGDTWASAAEACNYPILKSDDFMARIPAVAPASLTPGQPMAAIDACNSLQYTLSDANDPTSWRRMRIFPDALPDRSEARVLDTGMLRTPLAAFSDGVHTFGIFIRDQYASCLSNAECPDAMVCSKDASYTGHSLGGCEPNVALSSDAPPAYCRDDADCTSPAVCNQLERGVCLATQPFSVTRDGQQISTSWYNEDPRRGIATILHVASAFWPDRPEDFATGYYFKTNKFMNLTARAVAHFDPLNPENSDYSEGTETLLVWGRAAFLGRDGFQALPFFLYQPLTGLLDEITGAIAWAPRFFAGYDVAGAPAWSAREVDAQPIYGVDENLVQEGGVWSFRDVAPELDYVNQMSMQWVPQLGRWLMLYGGETPAQADPVTGKRPPPTHAQTSPGAIHLRSAAHPFGRARADAPDAQRFSPARPVLPTSAIADQLACDEETKSSTTCTPGLDGRPGDLWDALASVPTSMGPDDLLSASTSCIAGTVALDAQYSVGEDSAGHLYGASIIGSWTQDVTGVLPDLPENDAAVELYWNVSTWNPYQVLLMKTQLRSSDFQAGAATQ